jgi:DNA ligase-1
VKLFAELYAALDRTNRTAEKVSALANYFAAAPPRDAAWAVYVLSGRKIGRSVNATLLRQWASEVAGYPEWLVDQCYSVVGDLAEALALLLPTPAGEVEEAPTLHEVIENRLLLLARMPAVQQRKTIERTWTELNTEQRLVFHKLVLGNFRVGVSKALLIRSLAVAAQVEPAIIAHRLSGHWKPDEKSMRRLLAPHDPTAAIDAALPYPFMLANALAEPPDSLGKLADWLVEWKWDGIRAQLIRRGGSEGKTMLWSRGDESVGHTFPEIAQAGALLPDGTVLDGEIVAWNDSLARPMPFTKLQRRLNRQTVDMTFWPEVPVTFIAFDLLESQGRDVRELPLEERRKLLERTLFATPSTPALRLSVPLAVDDWESVITQMRDARQLATEGVMLKGRDSTYRPGRPAGLWWKLKVDPFTVDAVLIAAEPGHGRRAGRLTDYTFGVWQDRELVPIAKAYSGLTDAEIADMDRFIRHHTLARHGPVHAVEPTRVFELGFEAIQRSNRHKSGLAVRFPRILRIRNDKKPAEADRLETLQALLESIERP